MSAPLALDSTAGDPPIRREDYTHPGRGSQFEIFIPRIRFFDGCVFIVFGLNHPCAPSGTVFFVPSCRQRIMPCGFAANRHKRVYGPIVMTDRPPMEINVRKSGEVSVLEVHGRLTIGEPSEQLNAALQSVVQGGTRKVIVVLNGIPQIDSSGISTLVRISIQLARDGGVLRLVCGPGRVRDALTVTRLVEAIPTFETEAAALRDFA
jgi:anti-anti-sigma factor